MDRRNWFSALVGSVAALFGIRTRPHRRPPGRIPAARHQYELIIKLPEKELRDLEAKLRQTTDQIARLRADMEAGRWPVRGRGGLAIGSPREGITVPADGKVRTITLS